MELSDIDMRELAKVVFGAENSLRFSETGVAATCPCGSCRRKKVEGQLPGVHLEMGVLS
jgi:hypothetical protein